MATGKRKTELTATCDKHTLPHMTWKKNNVGQTYLAMLLLARNAMFSEMLNCQVTGKDVVNIHAEHVDVHESKFTKKKKNKAKEY